MHQHTMQGQCGGERNTRHRDCSGAGSSKAAGVKRGVSNNAAAALVAKHARNNDASTFQKARNDTVSSAIFDDDSDGDDAWPAIL